MDAYSGNTEPVTISDLLEIASWDRPRSNDELSGFVNRREQELGNLDWESHL